MNGSYPVDHLMCPCVYYPPGITCGELAVSFSKLAEIFHGLADKVLSVFRYTSIKASGGVKSIIGN